MKILLFKLSSLGDLIHIFPALTQLQKEFPSLEVTWVVESIFHEVPLWHPAVVNMIEAPLRAMKKDSFMAKCKKTLRVIKQIRSQQYDAVIDAQGLFKSALLARCARGPVIGFDRKSAREPVSWLYQKRVAAPKKMHAILRVNTLFSQALSNASQAVSKGADLSSFSLEQVNYGLTPWMPRPLGKILFFAHGTTWGSKHYPDEFWQKLVEIATKAGYEVWLPQVNEQELKRAEYLRINDQVRILPKMSITELRDVLYQVSGAICVDTGLAHIVAALGIPAVTLYGPTNPDKIGAVGRNQVHLVAKLNCAPCEKRTCFHPERDLPPTPPCFRTLPPTQVFKALTEILPFESNSDDRG